ncbi:ROK family protein [Actinopolyspora lacussalsi]|uniref:ROK family protein n=1 Tax=Actinopolyspora righensis TaxID=995060 RepID=UPI000B8230BE|nr:ROK family protein [Actinopolyspora righensis]
MTASTAQGRDPASLRRHNLRALLRHLHLRGPTSRVGLGEVTGLTRSAIADLVGELTERGLVLESGSSQQQPGRTGRGRPPLIVSLRDERAYVLAIAIDVDTVRIGRVGLGGNVLEEMTTQHEHSPGDPTPGLEQLARLVRELVTTTEAPPIAVGVAVPGLVRDEDGVVTRAPNLGWHELALGQRLRESADITAPVVVGNEARLAALAEHRRGAGRDRTDLVYVSAGVGVGAGIVAHDQLLTGNTGYAGEIGHMITSPGGRTCHCGARGCWETEIGADALLRRIGVVEPADRQAELERLFDRAERGDAEALDAFRQLCAPVATGLANLINIFDPGLVLLGGLLRPLLRHAEGELRHSLERVRGLPELPVELGSARLGEQGHLLGAAEAAVSSFLASFE